MTTVIRHISATPIATTTSLSVVLHATVVAAVLFTGEKVLLDDAVGEGIKIELISSYDTRDDIETERSTKRLQAVPVPDRPSDDRVPSESKVDTDIEQERDHESGQKQVVIASIGDEVTTGDGAAEQQKRSTQQLSKQRLPTQLDVAAVSETEAEAEALASVERSTSASQQHNTILELLHSRISEQKVYPYLARRQRREGVSTIAFVLYPDGRVERPELISSSQTSALDRAAISAVKKIEPFRAARDYLDTRQRFQVDVVFSLL